MLIRCKACRVGRQSRQTVSTD